LQTSDVLLFQLDVMDSNNSASDTVAILVGASPDYDGDGHNSVAFGGVDCDDNSPSVYAGAPDAWYDGVDSNCDAANDFDADEDGQNADAYGGTDCNDQDGSIYAGAPDAWYDGVDSDCVGNSDFDADADGHDRLENNGDDCDDTQATVYGGAEEVVGDGIDQDCDGADATEDTGDSDSSGDSETPKDSNGTEDSASQKNPEKATCGCASDGHGGEWAGWMAAFMLVRRRHRHVTLLRNVSADQKSHT
jgi:MYXO-CTERM domain-containing protein